MNRPLLACVVAALALGAARQHPEPPGQFLHDYPGTLHAYAVPAGTAWTVCTRLAEALTGTRDVRRAFGFYPAMLGCAFPEQPAAGHCVIVTTQGKPHVLRHEIAHCNGWAHP